jgi:hypothetical protein
VNRRGQDEAGRRRNIEDGLRGEVELAKLLMARGIGFTWPPKRGVAPDSVDFRVAGENWSVKASRMWMPCVCAAQIDQAADRYVFLALKGDDAEPLGIISATGFRCCARLIRRGEPITERFTAHYDMYVCDTRALDDLATVLDSLAPPGVVV